MAGEFTAAGEQIIAALMLALEKGARTIMDEADVLIPKDTHTARESAHIFPPVDEGDAVSVTFGFGYGGGINPKTGRPVEDYIVPLHEILEHHHEPPTTAKFLEIPVFAYAGEMERDLGQEIEAELRVAWGTSL